MQLVYVRSRKEYYPMEFPQSIKGDYLEYHALGEGYKKTKAFDLKDVPELPDSGSKVYWWDICKVWDKWGYIIAKVYANNKSAEIIAGDLLKGYYFAYNAIKDDVPKDFNKDFFEMMRPDTRMASLGIYSLDVIMMDEKFGEIDEEYDPAHTTYKGRKEVSMEAYVTEKYGKEYTALIRKCLCTEPE